MGSLPGLGYFVERHNYQREVIMKPRIEANESNSSLEKLSLADFGPGLGIDDHENGLVSEAWVLGEILGKSRATDAYNSSRRKRPRSRKTSEQVESQRMTHIAVERNRRKQMNEHLCILRSLMPTSYVQRGDQASVIGGAIEFVRELEQLAQCLESRKRRRVSRTDVPNDQMKLVEENENGISEENAEIKSSLADVEVKLSGVDGSIKILSRTRPGQLIKTIAALEDLELNIVRTNVTTVNQTAIYCFDFKINGDASRFTAEGIAKSAQQISSNFISKH